MSARRFAVMVGCVLAPLLLAGRIATAQGFPCHPTPLAPDDFTIVVLPDTQYWYTAAIHPYSGFWAETFWITGQVAPLNIAFVSHMGDIVNNANDRELQYQGAVFAFDELEGVVDYGFAPGNHDVEGAAGGVSRLYDEYFPVSRFLGRPGFGGSYNSNRSNYQLFSAAGLDFLVLHLELDPPDHVLEWANTVLAAHPDRRVIVMTHLFLTPTATSVSQLPASPWDRPDGNSPAEIWDELIEPSCNVFMVLNGHYVFGGQAENHITATNSCGGSVHLALQNYQDRSNIGWLRYYIFAPASDEIRAYTYAAITNVCETDANSQFVLPYDMGGP